jgi:hypothetical protein
VVLLVEFGVWVNTLGVLLDLRKHSRSDLGPFLDGLLRDLERAYLVRAIEIGLDELLIDLVGVLDFADDREDGDLISLFLVVSHPFQELVRVEAPTIELEEHVFVSADLGVFDDKCGVIPPFVLHDIRDQARGLGA